MDYIDLLTQEEKAALCQIITGREFKKLFKNNEREFQKIQRGFRAKTLVEEFALKTAIANIEKPFIAIWVNTRVDIWLEEIQDSIKQLEEKGFAHDVAFATTIVDSFFANDVDLYLKLSKTTLDKGAYGKLYEKMGNIKTARAKDA